MRNSMSTQSPRRSAAVRAIASRLSSSGCTRVWRSAIVQWPGRSLELQKIEHRGRPMDAAALQIPRPQAATSSIEREVDARAPGALLANAPALAPGVDDVEAARRDHQRDRRGEQEDRHPAVRRQAARCGSTGEAKATLAEVARKGPHGRELFVAAAPSWMRITPPQSSPAAPALGRLTSTARGESEAPASGRIRPDDRCGR